MALNSFFCDPQCTLATVSERKHKGRSARVTQSISSGLLLFSRVKRVEMTIDSNVDSVSLLSSQGKLQPPK